MKIKILESAKQDLREGFHFYESQEAGIGSPKLVLASGIAVFHGPHHKKTLTSDSWMEIGNS